MRDKKGILLLGGLIGAIMGVAIAWIFISEPLEEKRGLSWGKVIRMLLAVLGIVHQLADLRRKTK